MQQHADIVFGKVDTEAQQAPGPHGQDHVQPDPAPSTKESTKRSPRRSSWAPAGPPLAYATIQAEPSIALLLPCNVVVRSLEGGQTLVGAMDPTVMVTVTRNDRLTDVAAEAGVRLATSRTQEGPHH